MFERLKRTVDKFNQTLVEGSYRLQPLTFLNLIRGLKPELPATSEVAVGTTMIDTSKSWGGKFLWGSAIALLSMKTLMWAAIGLGVTGVGVYTMEYFRAKNARDDVLTEINFAGQRVQGKRSDLYRLHRAQLLIMNISSSLEGNQATTTADAIRRILDTVKDERARVEVMDSGRYGAGATAYAFSEPGFRLLQNDGEEIDAVPEVTATAAAPANGHSLNAHALRHAWDNKRVTPDEFVERLAALQEALPPDIAEKLQQRLAAIKPVNDDASTAAAAQRRQNPKP